MKNHLIAIGAAGALSAVAAATPASADARGTWVYGSPNVKVCASIDVQTGPAASAGAGGARVTVTNTDSTSLSFVVTGAAADLGLFDALEDACDHADDNSREPHHKKTYLVFVSGNAPGVPVIFGGFVGNLPTTGPANAGTNGFVSEVRVKTNN